MPFEQLVTGPPVRLPRHLKARTSTFPPLLAVVIGLLAGVVASFVIYGSAVAILDRDHPRPGEAPTAPLQRQDVPAPVPSAPAPQQPTQRLVEA